MKPMREICKTGAEPGATCLGATRLSAACLSAAPLAFAVFSPIGLAQSYPVKPIKSVVTAGGPAEVIARLIAQKLADGWGQPVLVENRGGGGSVIGTDMVAKSAPDGYTLLLTAFPFTTNAAILPKLPYDTQRDFAPVTLAAAAPLIVVVHPSLPVRSIMDLVALAKAKPGQLSYASSGNGGPQHLAGELFNYMAGVSTTHVPYKGTGAATSDLVGGHVPMSFKIGRAHV